MQPQLVAFFAAVEELYSPRPCNEWDLWNWHLRLQTVIPKHGRSNLSPEEYTREQPPHRVNLQFAQTVR